MTNDYFEQILFAVSFLLNLIVVGILWGAAYRTTTARSFWGMLAAGWTLNLIGNLTWTAYELIGGAPLPSLSWLDIVYVLRYLLVGLAFWRYPTVWPPRRSLEVGGVMLLVGLITWLGYYLPVLSVRSESTPEFWGYFIYLVLDGGLIYSAWIRARATRETKLGAALNLLALALLMYGVANWLNLVANLHTLEIGLSAANFFWLLSDLLTGWAAIRFWRN